MKQTKILTATGSHYNPYVEHNVWEKFTLMKMGRNIYIINETRWLNEVDDDYSYDIIHDGGMRLCSTTKWNKMIARYGQDDIITWMFCNGIDRLENTEWKFE